MARKSKGKAPAKPNPDAVTIYGKPGGNAAAELAEAYLRPTIQAGSTIRAYIKGKDSNGPDTDINALVAELGKQANAVSGGDLRRAEAMLIAQAHSLDAIFGNLARRAIVQEHLPQYEAHLRLALKAQSQCRATLETLAFIKNPAPVAFVRQANFGQAVQVNNAAVPEARAREIESEQSKLLEAQDGKRLDTGAPSEAGSTNQPLEAVGAVHWSQDAGRQVEGS